MRRIFRLTLLLGMVGAAVAFVQRKAGRAPAEAGPSSVAGHVSTSGESDQPATAAGQSDTSGSSDAPASPAGESAAGED